ncbi:heparinase II/III domain-containing protein [Paenibacillus roseipurpureus]|uniref:Heparinase II/III family protein n=1 Tax=Paenibacillus roseopurpureus TaxID=2918901 RepID=A0AA96RM71_9BACL|nr:heparinase II/III family protein [Paenibacillus sp. MBLB1832]WNR46161.1 heparinase II/III family protein [Paenibacillus sp. MBLB1832]
MISEKFRNILQEQHMISREQFQLFPSAGDRVYWGNVPGEVRKLLIEQGEIYAGYNWPIVSACMMLEISRTGSFDLCDETYLKRRTALGTLVVAECIEGQGRFLDDIVNGIWAICEETSWIGIMHSEEADLPLGQGYSLDLRAAETGSLLAWVSYLLRDELNNMTPHITQRIELEVKRRILDSYMGRDDYFWMGFVKKPVNNWNPWINSCFLTALMLVEEDPNRRMEGLLKFIASLDVFLESYHSDGGCDEGTTYWDRAGGALLDCLELLKHATGGFVDLFNEPLIQNIGRYIYRAHIHDTYFINFADGSAKINDFQSVQAFKYGLLIHDQNLCSQAANQYRLKSVKFTQHPWFPMLRSLSEIKYYPALLTENSAPPYLRDVWLDGIQVMAAREHSGSPSGLYLATKGGHNEESHNHNDIGQFILYSDGNPIIIDAGVNSYNKKTFSDQRYEIWTMRSTYHNVPTINGVEQHHGREYQASSVVYTTNEDYARLTLDIAPAYPSEAGVREWIRTVTLNRSSPASVTLLDTYDLLSTKNALQWQFMTCCEVKEVRSGELFFQAREGSSVRMVYPSDQLQIMKERIETKDKWMTKVWGEYIYRITFSCLVEASQGSFECVFEQVAKTDKL